jgi:hypothetical protein
VLYTSNKFHLAVSIPGVTLDAQSWDKFTGGDHTSETQQHTPGGMGPQIAIGGIRKRSPVTVSRAMDDTLIGLYESIDAATGGPITITVQPLINPTTVAGKGRTYTGVIKTVKPPDQDSTTSTITMLSVEVELNETIA